MYVARSAQLTYEYFMVSSFIFPTEDNQDYQSSGRKALSEQSGNINAIAEPRVLKYFKKRLHEVLRVPKSKIDVFSVYVQIALFFFLRI